MNYVLHIRYKSGGRFIFPNRNGMPLEELFVELRDRAGDNALHRNVQSWTIFPVE